MRNFGQRGYGFWSFGEGTISGQCTDHAGLIGPKGAKVPCGELRAAMEGLPPGSYPSYTPPADDSAGSKAADWLDDTFGITDPKAAEIPMGAYVLVLGLVGFGIYTYTRRKGA